MSLFSLVLAVSLAQPVVRPLEVQGEVTSEAQVIAANEAFIWFTAGEASSWRRGGARVFRLSRDGGAVDDVISGNDWSGTDLLHHAVPGSSVVVGGHPRGDALFTVDGEFRAHGRLLMSPETPDLVVPAGANIVWFSSTRPFLSSAPGVSQRLDAPRLAGGVVSTTDGRVAWVGQPDGGSFVTVIVNADAGLTMDASRLVAASAGARLLFVEDGGLTNELGELLVTPRRVLMQAQGRVLVSTSDGGLVVTDGTRAGTRTLNTTRFPSQLTGSFVTSQAVDGGLIVEALATGQLSEVGAFFAGRPLADRLLNRNVELFADGGLIRRADVHDCDWRTFESTQLFCEFDGALWVRPTPDAPQQVVAQLTPRGRGTGLMQPLQVQTDDGAPMLLTFPFPMWTDGVVARSFAAEGPVIGQSRGQVVLPVDGVTLVNPVTLERKSLGLATSWKAITSLRELFIQRPDDLTCVVRRLDARGSFVDVEPLCLRELVDVPGALLGHGSRLEWLRWDSAQRRFTALDVTPGFQLAEADRTWAVFGTTTFVGSVGGPFVDTSDNTLVRLSTGATETFEPGTAVGLTEQGVFSWKEGVATLRTASGERFSIDAARLQVVSSTSKALWLVTEREVLVSTGGAFHSVTTDAATWANSAAVGSVLFLRNESELVTLSMTGEVKRFPFVEARRSFRTGDVRWFSLDDGVHGFEPWLFDGESLQLMADLNPGVASSFPNFLGLARGRLVLEAGRADGTIGLTSLEFQPIPDDPTVPLPDSGCGCSGAAFANVLLAALVLRTARRRRA
ncbi:MAG: hypothetical protein ABTQ32_18835 [Myxococcaceae bacterium]